MLINLPFVKKELVMTVHNPNNLPTIDFHKLKDLQGDLKITTPAKIEKLKNSIRKYGIFIPKFVWINNGIYYIEDGHQTIKALTELEKAGYNIPPIPYVIIEAKDRKDAGEKLLMINSRFADINPETSFFKDFDIGLEFVEEIEIPELEMSFEGLEGDGSGEIVEHTKLTDKFIVPPFSVLDTRQGYWQDRKRAWIALGIRGEEGRGENLTIKDPALGYQYDANDAKAVRREADKRSDLKNVAKLPNYVHGGGGAGMEYIAPNTSIFDPVLSELAYKWFCMDKGTILDPFAGGSVRGIVAAYLGYRYTGIELREEQVNANVMQAEEIIKDGGLPEWIIGDSNNIDALIEDKQYDFIFSCPPYYDLEVYSDLEGELSAIKNYEEFITLYHHIIAKCVDNLKDNRFACFVVGDIRDKKGFYRNFVSDTILGFQNAGMQLYNEAILVNVVGSLPIRIQASFGSYRKLGKTHQNVLVFFKGDPKTIKDNYGEIEIVEIEEENQ